jgi:hypothetical protein
MIERLQSFVVPIRRGMTPLNLNPRCICLQDTSSLDAKFCFPIVLIILNVGINASPSFPAVLGPHRQWLSLCSSGREVLVWIRIVELHEESEMTEHQ